MKEEQYVTKDMLLSFGVAIDGAALDSLLQRINTTVEERVGTEIIEALSDDQLAALLSIQENGTDEQLSEWIEKNIPKYAEITEDTIAITVAEMVENIDKINQM